MMSDSLSPQSSLMVVYVAGSAPEAQIVAGRLQSEGLETFIHHEPAGAAYGITVGSLGLYRVLVPADSYEQAKALLDADHSDDLDLIELDAGDEE
ncbi:MAG: DUF2007 domain-containing protein [bacterium]|nr:DUF2007 domain-containing protein [bacterium]